MADPNQTPQRGNWVCPCNGCKKAAKQVVDQIVEDYMSCPNIMEEDDKTEIEPKQTRFQTLTKWRGREEEEAHMTM